MKYSSVTTVCGKSDCFKPGKFMKAVMEILDREYNLNGDRYYIKREDLFRKLSQDYIKTTDKIKNEKYIRPDGTKGSTYITEALDMTIAQMRQAGCIIDKEFGTGYYSINKNIHRYFNTDTDAHIDDILNNFGKSQRKNLVKEFVKNNPEKLKVVLIKKIFTKI